MAHYQCNDNFVSLKQIRKIYKKEYKTNKFFNIFGGNDEKNIISFNGST